MIGWFPSWVKACEEFRLVAMTEVKFWGLAGVPLPDIVRSLYAETNSNEVASDEFVANFIKYKMEYHATLEAKSGSPPAIECVVARAQAYRRQGIKIAIASSGLRDAVERHCEHANIFSIFDAVVVAAEVPRGKPHPDVFLRAAEMIGVDPRQCRAYEVGGLF